MRILTRIRLLLFGLWHISALRIDTVYYESNITVLLLGSSVDRYALEDFCKSVDGGMFQSDEEFTRPLANPNNVYICSIAQRNIKLAYMFIPGSGPPPYWGCFNTPTLCGNHTSDGHIQHATTEDIIDIDAPNLATRALKALAPTIIVVDSSLWDMARWWYNRRKPPMGTYPIPDHEIQRWCTQEIPQLLERVGLVFPTSQILFRTPPTVISKQIGETPEAIERMVECIRNQIRKDAIFDYHQMVDGLIREAAEHGRDAQSIFRDKRHPGECAGTKYLHAILSAAGMRADMLWAENCNSNGKDFFQTETPKIEIVDP